MIDAAELNEMRHRVEGARPAVDAVLVRQDDGLWAGVPYEDPEVLLEAAVESARDVPTLLGEVEWLAPAAYLYGVEECIERECDHFADDDGNPTNQDDEHCPHVQERVARLGDVKKAEYLERLVAELRQRLADGVDADPADLVERIDCALEEMRADDDIREVVAAAQLLGAGEPGTPHDSGPDHCGGEVSR